MCHNTISHGEKFSEMMFLQGKALIQNTIKYTRYIVICLGKNLKGSVATVDQKCSFIVRISC